MSLEAIAALLGHRSMRMTMTYARISDRTVADEYFRVTEAVEANYGRTDAPSRRLQRVPICAGWPPTTAGCSATGCAPGRSPSDCSFESACERCNFFETGPQFIPILRRQRDHAAEHDQAQRADLFERLIKGIDGDCLSVVRCPSVRGSWITRVTTLMPQFERLTDPVGQNP